MVRKTTLLSLIFTVITYNLTAQCWTRAVAGDRTFFAFQSDSTLWSWGGGNDVGQAGNCTFSGTLTPFQIGDSAQRWLDYSYTSFGGLALGNDTNVWVWGNNNFNRLLDTSSGNIYCPQIASEANKVSMVSISATHALVLVGPYIWSWGGNGYRQLGDTTFNDNRSIEVRVVTNPQDTSKGKWIDVSAANNSSFAIREDGTLWGWGRNDNYRLGDGTSIDRNMPTQIGQDSNWVSIESSTSHSLAIKDDSTLWAWGRNSSGQIGDGTLNDALVPKQVGTDSDWILANVNGSNTSYAIKKDGSLWAWGYNGRGQLGDGSTMDRLTPVEVGKGNHWVSISGALHSAIGVTKDGRLMQVDTSHTFQEVFRLSTCDYVSVPEIEQASHIEIFPNPSKTGVITIGSSQTHINEIVIMDILGNNLFQESYHNVSEVSLNLPAAAGLYFVNVDGKVFRVFRE